MLSVPTEEIDQPVVNSDWQIQLGHLLQDSGMPCRVKSLAYEMTVTDVLERSMFVMVLSREIITTHGEPVGRNAKWSEKDRVEGGIKELDRVIRELRFSP